jgi:hypothetical protein
LQEPKFVLRRYFLEIDMSRRSFFSLIRIAVAAGTLVGATQVGAVPLVDTGQPTGNSGGANLEGFYYTQYLAGEFTLNGSYIITGVEGYMEVYRSGVLNLRIYSDGGAVPGSNLYSGTVTPPVSGLNWQGLTGLNWALGPGTYWIAAEPSTNFSGYMPGGPPNLLSGYAYLNPGPNWSPYPLLQSGYRIFGDPASQSAVPLPAALPLFVSGLGLIGFTAWRRKRQAERAA